MSDRGTLLPYHYQRLAGKFLTFALNFMVSPFSVCMLAHIHAATLHINVPHSSQSETLYVFALDLIP
jgi:hypothetical protein